MQLRVRSLGGAELTLDVPQYTVRLRVAEIKRLSLLQLLESRVDEEPHDEETKESEPIDMTPDRDTSLELQAKMESSCLVFRGQILADADDVNMFAVAPSDFFVLIEEIHEDDRNTEGESDEEMKHDDGKDIPHKRRRTTKTQEKQVIQDASMMQLMEMGFDADQARNALELTNGELSRAVALLMGEDIASTDSLPSSSTSSHLITFVAKLIQRYPELAAIESLLMDENVHKLKKLARTSDFDAFVLLKESFPAHWLSQMNENPAAMVFFLSLPQHFETKPKSTNSNHKNAVKKTLSKEIDLTLELEDDVEIVSASVAVNANDQDAIERLTAMGFAPDLVVAVYESCGGNEEIAANLLFETLA